MRRTEAPSGARVAMKPEEADVRWSTTTGQLAIDSFWRHNLRDKRV